MKTKNLNQKKFPKREPWTDAQEYRKYRPINLTPKGSTFVNKKFNTKQIAMKV